MSTMLVFSFALLRDHWPLILSTMFHPYSTIEVLEQCKIGPPPNLIPTTSLPLTFFDIPWLFCCPMQCLFFYELPYPTDHFKQTILPILKHSLSLTFQHFFPLASNLICPPHLYGIELIFEMLINMYLVDLKYIFVEIVIWLSYLLRWTMFVTKGMNEFEQTVSSGSKRSRSRTSEVWNDFEILPLY